jgi:hypothetical protein
MKKILTVYICVFAVFFLGCEEKKKSGDYYIGASNEPIPFNTYVSEVEFYPLDMSDEFLIGRIDKIIRKDSLFYILDGKLTKSLFTFGLSGKGYQKLNNVGNGPNEYLDIADFDLIPTKNEIAILCNPYKLMFVDMNMTPKREIILKNDYKRIICIDKFLYLYYHDYNRIDRLDIETNQIKTIFSGINLKGYTFNQQPVFYRVGKNIYFHSPGSDIIFKWVNEQFFPEILLDFDKKEKSMKYYLNTEYYDVSFDGIANNPLPTIESIFEIGGNIGFVYSYNILVRFHLSDKDEHVDKALIKFCGSFYEIGMTDSGKLLTWVDPAEMEDELINVETISPEKVKQLLSRTDEVNPILIEYTMKKE